MLCAYDEQRNCHVAATFAQGQSRRNSRPSSHRYDDGAVELTGAGVDNIRRTRRKKRKQSELCTYDSLCMSKTTEVRSDPTATSIGHTGFLGMYMAGQLERS